MVQYFGVHKHLVGCCRAFSPQFLLRFISRDRARKLHVSPGKKEKIKERNCTILCNYQSRSFVRKIFRNATSILSNNNPDVDVVNIRVYINKFSFNDIALKKKKKRKSIFHSY